MQSSVCVSFVCIKLASAFLDVSMHMCLFLCRDFLDTSRVCVSMVVCRWQKIREIIKYILNATKSATGQTQGHVFFKVKVCTNDSYEDGRHGSSSKVRTKHLYRPLVAGCAMRIGHTKNQSICQIIFPACAFVILGRFSDYFGLSSFLMLEKRVYHNDWDLTLTWNWVGRDLGFIPRSLRKFWLQMMSPAQGDSTYILDVSPSFMNGEWFSKMMN